MTNSSDIEYEEGAAGTNKERKSAANMDMQRNMANHLNCLLI